MACSVLQTSGSSAQQHSQQQCRQKHLLQPLLSTTAFLARHAVATSTPTQQPCRRLKAPTLRCQSSSDRVLGVVSGFDYEAQLQAAQKQSLQEYEQLKQQLLRTTQRFGGGLTVYLFLVASGQAALCAMVGGATSYGYLLWLFRDLDAVQVGDSIPATEAEKIAAGPLRTLAKVAAAYRQALRPRLLLLVGLAAAVYGYNKVAPEPLPLVDEASLLAGFFSYKAALLMQLWDATKPKFDPEALKRPKRPEMVSLDDDEITF